MAQNQTPSLRVGVRFVLSGLIFPTMTAILYIIPYIVILNYMFHAVFRRTSATAIPQNQK